MKRYQRVNLYGGEKQYLQNCESVFQRVKNDIKTASKETLPEDKRDSLDSVLSSSDSALLYYHFELPSPPIKSSTFIAKSIDAAVMFFYCEKKSKRWIQWNRAFHWGTLFSLLKNDKQSLTKISEWVDRAAIKMNDKHPFDLSTSATINYFSPLFFVFAQYFLGLPREKYSKEIDGIKNGTRLATKTLLKIWESIYAKDSVAFEKQIVQLVNKHVQQIKKTKFPSRIAHIAPLSPQVIVSQEATWMWNIALRSGMPMPELPEEIMDRIMTPQSIGLEK